MLTFIWNVLTIPAAVVTLIVSVFFLVVGLWNSGLLLWNRIDTVAERDEMKNYFVEIGAAIAGILTALRALAMIVLLILAMLALDIPTGGTGAAKAATIIHCDDRTGCRSIEAPRPALNPRSKIARNIQKRPNVEISRPVKVRGRGNFTAHFCGLGMGNWCGGMNALRRQAGGEVYSHVSDNAAVADIVRLKPRRINLAGHSMGCRAAFNTAALLADRGIRVHTVVCFDGPRHFAAMPDVPRNVARVISWRQGSPFQLGGATICRGKTYAGICNERRGDTVIHEETVNLGHMAIAHDRFIRMQAVAALRS